MWWRIHEINIQLFLLLFKTEMLQADVHHDKAVIKFLTSEGVSSFEIHRRLSTMVKGNTAITSPGVSMDCALLALMQTSAVSRSA
jgi:hypothetical protein